MEDTFEVNGIIYEDLGGGKVRVVGYANQDAGSRPTPRVGAPITPPRPRLPTPQTAAQAEKDILDVRSAREKPGNTRFEQASKLRDDYERSPAVRQYNTFLNSYIPSLQNSGTPGSDLQLIYAYAKVMDPDSAVREGEAASIAGGDSVYNQTVAKLGRELDGNGQFTPQYRKQLLLEMNRRGVVMRNSYLSERDRYSEIAKRNNLPVPDVVGPDRGENTRYAKLEKNFWNQGDTRMNDASPGGYEARAVNTSIAGQALGLDAPANIDQSDMGRRYTDQEARELEAAIRSGDFGQAVAIAERVYGPQGEESRNSIRNAIEVARKNPDAVFRPDYTKVDATRRQELERERYGEFLPQAIEERQNAGSADVFARGAANTGSAGVANYLEAGLDAALTDRDFMESLQRQRAIDEADRRNSPGTQIAGNLVGAIASPLGRARSVGGAIVNNAAVGGLEGALDSASIDEAVGRGAFGTVAGGLGGGLGSALGRGSTNAVGRALDTPEWAPLYRQGVRPTTGMRMGGVMNRIEEGSQSVPFLGGLVRGARDTARSDFERGAFQQSLGEIGQRLPDDAPLGTAAHAFAQRAFNDEYEAARAGMRFSQDSDFARAIRDARMDIRGGSLSAPEADRFEAILENQILRRLDDTGAMDGDRYKEAYSALGKLSATQRRDGNNGMADAIEGLQDALMQSARRHSDPEAVARMDATDRGYAQLVRIEDAARAAGGEPARFTPGAFRRAVQKDSGGVRSRAYLRGDALMQDYGDAGMRLVDKVADSGTPERAAIMGGLATATYFQPKVAIPMLAATLPYGLHRKAAIATPQFYANNAANVGSAAGRLGSTGLRDVFDPETEDRFSRKIMGIY